MARGKSVRRLGLAGAVLVAAVVGFGVQQSDANAEPTPTVYTGTLIQQRADSQIMKHTDGYYYFTGTVPEYDRIVVRRAKTLAGLASAPETVIWRRHATGEMANHIWAPELHFIDGKWYVYFAAGRSSDSWDIRMYVLEGGGDNPLTTTWAERGAIRTGISDEKFALDASTFVDEYDPHKTRYLIWTQRPPLEVANPTNTSIYIAKMGAHPWEITGTPALISAPTYPWEIQRYRVNEGPTVLQRHGKTFLTYSASATDTRYCLGMLTAVQGADLLNPKSWVKNPEPVFQSNAATGQYGPGHNSFVVAEDGKTDILVYHDRDYSFKDEDRSALDDVNRRTRIQPFTWNADGTPNFGVPVADATPVKLRLHSSPDLYVRHFAYRARLDSNVSPAADGQFRVVPGLAEGETVSLESANFPHYYLRTDNGEAWVRDATSHEDFRTAASFFRRPGLSGSGVSFEAIGYPSGRFLHRGPDDLLYFDKVSSEADKAQATFDFDPAPAALPAADPVPAPVSDSPSPPASHSPSPSASNSPSPSASRSPSASPSISASPTTSASASRSASPSAGPSGSPSRPPSGGSGGGLPLTGSPVALVGGFGIVAVAVGALLLVLTGRRRHRARGKRARPPHAPRTTR